MVENHGKKKSDLASKLDEIKASLMLLLFMMFLRLDVISLLESAMTFVLDCVHC